ncbi:MAG: NAD-dependent epimerase/dehydratase family protein [Candidatus Niyogibacteria bacterium]|nr:NAD-dependent epimerase/dehydratase family protein [Candidatus Niyogibacteria bacterium]
MLLRQPTNILITGAAGYVGGMLADQFSKRRDVGVIVCLDKEPMPALLHRNPKIIWIRDNTSSNTWQRMVALHNPAVVIHAAWQIREMYGKRALQWKWNVGGSQNVFDFAFSNPSVRKLVHFSSASCYGAFPSNTLDHWFREDEELREDEYRYGVEKIAAEEALADKVGTAERTGQKTPQIFVVRPAAITGPRGRFMFRRFGLQSVLRKGLPIIPVANSIWCRQFIHEDDVCDIVELLSFQELAGTYDVFNITPNTLVLARDMAEVMGKRTFRITPAIVRFAFWWLWHASQGRIPTSRGGWKFYSYPIVMDGSKITSRLGYHYQYESRPALEKIEGRYKKYAA